ncbi:MAG: hypothetical protein ACTHKR_10390 [Sphingomonas sp.]
MIIDHPAAPDSSAAARVSAKPRDTLHFLHFTSRSASAFDIRRAHA